ncbi:Thioredoxin, putative (fragment) [Capnocytophaga canimorsus]
MYGVQKLYNDYKDKMDFYIITNELPEPVETLMEKRGFDFQVTYLILGEKMPFDAEVIPSGYLIDKGGKVVARSERNARWNSQEVRQLIEQLL